VTIIRRLGTSSRLLQSSRNLIAPLLAATLAFLIAFLLSCQGLPANVANCPITPTPPANTSVVPPAQEPPPQALCAFPMAISEPAPVASGTSAPSAAVTSPVHFVANASPPDPIYTMRLYVDGAAVLYSPTTSIDQFIWMANGQHTIEIVAEDVAGYIATSTTTVNVTAQAPGVTNIQNLPDWTSCSAQLTTGMTCAAGLGVAVSSLAQHQEAPALDGSSGRFSLAGPHPYSNELYWSPFGGGNSVSHFTYDLWFYLDDGNAPQSLEFDVNQAFGGTRWTFGTQCDFDQTGKWDLWDDSGGVWRPSNVPCNHFPSQTWIHLIWNFERVGNKVHYISVSVADNSYNVDTYYTAQSNWYQEEIDIAFQLDGNYQQHPYSVWLDEVQLDAY
jgi:hypothetical protein